MPQAIIALPITQQDRKSVPDVWLLIADLVSQQDIRTVSHTSRWLNKVMARHPLGYIVARIRGTTPQGSAAILYAALKHADTTNRFIDIVAAPDAFPHDDQLGGEMPLARYGFPTLQRGSDRGGAPGVARFVPARRA